MNPGRCGQAPRLGCASSGAAAGRAIPERGGCGAGRGGRPRRRWTAARARRRPDAPDSAAQNRSGRDSRQRRRGQAGANWRVVAGALVPVTGPLGGAAPATCGATRRPRSGGQRVPNPCIVRPDCGGRRLPAPVRARRRGGSPVLQAELVVGFSTRLSAEHFLVESNTSRLIRLVALVSFHVYVQFRFIGVHLKVLPTIFFSCHLIVAVS